jgi:predicted DNA binding CopG/RHH family protein
VTDKRYQVFISATYTDLREERGVLLQTLPTLGCLPTTVEAHTQSLSTMVNIRRRIDDCDYFLLLVGSRYGSLMPSGVSYTHMEYVYAATKQKPILVLMHESPETRAEDLQEQKVEGKLKFGDFRKVLQREREHIVYWRDAKDLASALHNAIPALLRRHPTVGWARISKDGVARAPANAELEKECELLRKRVKELEAEREKWLSSAVGSTENLAKGEDLLDVVYRCKAYAGGNCQDVNGKTRLSWNELLVSFGSNLLQAQTEEFMAAKINERLQKNALVEIQKEYPKTHAVVDVQISPSSFNAIKMQFRVLGVIQRVTRDNDQKQWWQMTAVGERNLTTIMSVRRGINRPVI